MKLVSNLKPGDAIDLSNDPFAGNCTDPDCTSALTWEYEYGIVWNTEVETPDCIRVDFENGESIGFPTNHRVRDARHAGIHSVAGWFRLPDMTYSLNSNDNPMDRIRALAGRLEETATKLGLTMENFAVLPGDQGDNPVDMCQVVFSLAAENLMDDPSESTGSSINDSTLDDDEAAAFASLENIVNEPDSAGDDPDRPSAEDIKDFLGEDDD